MDGDPKNNQVCVFVSSSDNTADVFGLIGPNIYQAWKDVGLTLFVGTNTKIATDGFQAVYAKVSDWSHELHEQLEVLGRSYKWVILILDDFHFSKAVEQKFIAKQLMFVSEMQPDYLRLISLKRSFCIRLLKLLCLTCRSKPPRRLSRSEPYYSALQVAVWNIEYLKSRLLNCSDIWGFEEAIPSNSQHYCVNTSPLKYQHLVEKGRWLPQAPSVIGTHTRTLFKQRGFVTAEWRIRHSMRRVLFFLFGYSSYKIKKSFDRLF